MSEEYNEEDSKATPQQERLSRISELLAHFVKGITKLTDERADLTPEQERPTRADYIAREKQIKEAISCCAWSPELAAILEHERKRVERMLFETSILVKPQPKSGGRIGGIEV